MEQDFYSICFFGGSGTWQPEPDVFLEAARRLGCKPEHSLVIEDGVKGVMAAKNAGMVFYVNPQDPEASLELIGISFR